MLSVGVDRRTSFRWVVISATFERKVRVLALRAIVEKMTTLQKLVLQMHSTKNLALNPLVVAVVF